MKPKEKFRESLIRHMTAHGITASQLARDTGVSKAQIDKLVQRRVASTNAHDAMLMARYFGKTFEEFLDEKNETPKDHARLLLSQISDAELDTVIAQLEGMIARKKGR